MMREGRTISRHPLPCPPPAYRGRENGGFTLTELLVVIVIMTLLLVIAVPAFNYMTGSRSIEAAQNLAGAMIQRARNAALAEGGRYCGVLFYEDPVSRRTTMTIVEVSSDSGTNNSGDGDQYQQYKAWQSNVTYKRPSTATPAAPFQPDRVYFMTQDSNFGGRMMTYLWEAKPDANNSTNETIPPNNPPPKSIPTALGSNYPADYQNDDWRIVAPGNLTPLPADDINAGVQQLPKGVRIQVMVDNKGNTATDRYMTTGLILFDPQGHLAANQPFQVQLGTTVAEAMNLTTAAPASFYLYSGVGLAVYDRSAFEASHPATTENGVTINAFKASDGDGVYTPPHLALPSDTGGYTADEENEEKWLDQNAARIMIGRSNGVLMGGTP